MPIPREILDEIAARNDIVSVVSEYVPLKRTGSNYTGLCPFHNEKTPSFSVSPNKQFFYCFGCGKGGDVFRFLMDIEGLTFTEAAERLAKRAGVQIPEQELTAAQLAQQKQRRRQLQINDFAARYYHKVLLESKDAEPYRAYLRKRRVSEESIERFQLGATPPGWNGLCEALRKRGVTAQEMLELGLVSESRRPGKYVDRFRGRLMFPICNERGERIAFGGRILDAEKRPQKYLNSPETPLFHKSRTLYGLHLARNSIRSQDLALLVEGYMDVIACHQAGITNAVAPLGTAFTHEQGRLLMRSTYQIGISLDGDAAGVRAAMRTLDVLADLGCTARVVTIPDGQDPDEFLQSRGKDAFLRLIDGAQDAIAYKIERYMETADTDTIGGKMQVVGKLLPDLEKMQSAVAREEAVRQISRALSVSEKAILEELRRLARPTAPQTAARFETRQPAAEADPPAEKIASQAERVALQLLYTHPDYLSTAEQYGGAELFSPAGAKLYEEFQTQILRSGKAGLAGAGAEESVVLADLLMQETYVADPERTFADSLRQLKQERLDQSYQALLQQLARPDQPEETRRALLERLDAIRRAKKTDETAKKGD